MSAGISEVQIGQLFGADERYMLLRLVGTGAMASVWVANDSRSGGEVAVKILSGSVADAPAFGARFEREAQLAARLSHPNVVRVLDHNADDTRPYLVMENVAGGTLAERLSSGPLDRWDVQELAQDLLGTLAYLHGAGVLHRDLEPANVLLGTDGRLRLTLFGFTPRAGKESIGSDLYACGLLLAGCVGPDAPAPLLDLIDRLSSPDPALRPATAVAALALLGVELPADFPPVDFATHQYVPSDVPSAEPVTRSDFPPAAMLLPPVTASAWDERPSWLESASPAAYPPAPPRMDADYKDEYEAAYQAAYTSYVPRRRRPVKRIALAIAIVPVALAIAAFGMATSGDDKPETPLPPPAQGTLTQQLDGLDQAIDLART